MAGDKGISRRDFLKGLITGGTVVNSLTMCTSLASSGTGLWAFLTDDSENTGPVTKEEAAYLQGSVDTEHTDLLLLDRKISGEDFKLCGVSHIRETAQVNYDLLEELVKNSSVTIVEGGCNMGLKFYKKSHGNHAAGNTAFFSTIGDLCKKYDKPVIDIDPIETPAASAEVALGIGGAIYSIIHGSKVREELLNKNMKDNGIFKKGVNRRKFFTSSAKMFGGAYFALSGLFSSILPKIGYYSIKYGGDLDKAKRDSYDNEYLFYSHITDHRNVGITKGMKELPSLLDKKDLANGDYILAVFGAAHIIGSDFYLKHPTTLKVKDIMYQATYELVDHDPITRYYFKNGEWDKKILKE
ncbi:MAG: hypothetical protein KKA79_05995 [Nanoarchaeota archaeon]|nr:hypothetical protein [Nanoarchaeota archaeon]MCG2717627.1 hypothetical protein [Nanoarchaeota archaeon]